MKNLGIYEKVYEAIEKTDYDAVISVGPDNIQYLCGAALPFLYNSPDRPVIVLWPKKGSPSIICPVEWVSTLHSNSWIIKVLGYIEGEESLKSSVVVLAKEVRDFVGEGANIGLDMNRVSNVLFKELEQALSGIELLDCSDWLRKLRVGAAHHIIVTHPKTEMALAEDTRVHCIERELDTVGHHSMAQATSGENVRKLWPLVERYSVGWEKRLRPGEMVRLGMISSYDGYWSNITRMVINGEPTLEQSQAFEELVTLRKKAISSIRPGINCSNVYRSVVEEAERNGIKLIKEMGVGHGIGVTSSEAPYLTAWDETLLEPGMVLVLDPVIIGPEGEILRSKDTIKVTETGCKILGWYINWRAPYIAAYNL
jgi:Xaa-Pro aminopeptidase